ncbi:MAG: hypothetical protein K2X93_17165, partial [Candidatus Obscuribacterales bacterium]|nr:hypothetical protein [Candidatus Obscuribacterales bacterium]
LKKTLQQVKGSQSEPMPEKKDDSDRKPVEKPLSALKSGESDSDDEEENDDSFIYANIEDAIKETLGDEIAMYLHPKDAGIVKLKGGSAMPTEEIERVLPRLKSFKLRLHIVRREKLKKWTVYHFGFIEPKVQLGDGSEVVLVHYRNPSGEKIPEPGPEVDSN